MKKFHWLLLMFFSFLHGEISTPVVIGPGTTPHMTVDRNGDLHIIAGAGVSLLYYHGTRDGNFDPPQVINRVISSGTVTYSRLAEDKNGNLHICFTTGFKNDANKIYYMNNISGTWGTPELVLSSNSRTVGLDMAVDSNLNVFIASNRNDDRTYLSDLIKVTDAATNPRMVKQVDLTGMAPRIAIDASSHIHAIFCRGFSNIQWIRYDTDLNPVGSVVTLSGGINVMRFFYNSSARYPDQAVQFNVPLPWSQRGFTPSLVWDHDTLLVFYQDTMPRVIKMVNLQMGQPVELSPSMIYSQDHTGPIAVPDKFGGVHIIYAVWEGTSKIEYVTYRVQTDAIEMNRGNPNTISKITASPNPFNSKTTIFVTTPEKQLVNLEIFNIRGERLSILPADQLNSGKYSVSFKMVGLNSGLYFVRLRVGSKILTRKLVLSK
jgi:hypothetical protein